MKNKSVCIAFLGNISFDTRTLNFYKSLKEKGYAVEVICFEWKGNKTAGLPPNVKIYTLNKKKSSIFFYAKFAYKLFINLLKSKAGVFFAEDIYTLPFVCIAAKFKNAKVIYDSRELFGFLAGLKSRRALQKMLASIEKRFIGLANNVIVTGDMDGEFLHEQYGIANLITIRNLPFLDTAIKKNDLHSLYGIDENKKILVYQGVILHGRGLRYVFNYLKTYDESVLVVFGDGEQKKFYEDLAVSLGIQKKVIFAGKVPQEELLAYSAGADIGLSLIENISLSYYFALPNKLFEYIMAGLPVIVSNLPQMKQVIANYKVGASVDIYKEEELNDSLHQIITNNDVLKEYRENCKKAALELNWNNEIKKLFDVLD